MYPNGLRYWAKPFKVNFSASARAGKVRAHLVWVLSVLLLISSGVVYRVLASRLQLVLNTSITLPVSLSAFPTQIGNWIGSDLSIPNITVEYMQKHFADDFLSRRYVNSVTKAWADVYIVYCSSRPAGILGHRPRVCYLGHGWVHDSTETSQFTTQAGQQISCLIHRFHKPAPMYERAVVLNFYIFNGQITTSENDFSGPFSRRPNLTHNPARYVAQVQISSVLENTVRTAGGDIADLILDFFPDEDGHVRKVQIEAKQ